MSGTGGTERPDTIRRILRWFTGTWTPRNTAPTTTADAGQTPSANEYFETAAKYLARFSVCLVGSVAIWSFGSGVLHAVGLSQPLYLVGLYTVYALGALLVLGLSGAMGGGVLGFLFGLPRAANVVPAPPPPATEGTNAGASVAVRSNGRSYQLSDNLLQITDWLTKIIVGVGLVEARQMYGALNARLKEISAGILDGKLGADLVVPAVFVASVVLGFIFFYLLTTAIIAPMLQASEDEMGRAKERFKADAVQVVLSTVATPHAKAELEEGGNATKQMESAAAAKFVSELAWEEVEQRKNPDWLLAWAASKTSSANFSDAAKAYRAYLSLIPAPRPVILQEARRVFAQAASQLNRGISGAAPVADEKERIRLRNLRNEVVGLLYKKDGFRQVLEKLIDGKDVVADVTGALAMYRAFALGQQYAAIRNNEPNATGWETAKISATALADIDLAVSRGQSKDWIRYVWDPNDKSKPIGPEREDDLECFSDDPEFRTYFGVGPA